MNLITEFSVSRIGSECRIAFAQPDSGNTLSLNGLGALADSIRAAGRDPAVKLIRISATGASFCGGRAANPPSQPVASPEQFRRAIADPILGVYRALHESEIPVLAEVQGDAQGFGCALVAACDLAIASAEARFSLPELQKNLPPTLVWSVLRHRVPPKAAAHMIYLTDTIDAKTAREWDLVAEVVPAGTLASRGDAISASICSRDRIALSALKAYFREIVIPDFSLASETAGLMLSCAMTSIRRD
ncbi:enoyl-CoA hydratase/isomerase family protein [Burkholderia sp. Ax-1724]|uniref:enoyl-CoA hydratase/isomerase family protein n=1 Tax=Burkholderia sp. Ax-1724 TaxID=2608336 RepID=UPI001424040E|nr:enoyl-CoA hydratase/isomerase family protein [Burkholderia sp. Ax-1724]NIF53781.1 enoyl-CoA hydratase/isomerase family protein [Burkholderia sp. Ax-1724]